MDITLNTCEWTEVTGLEDGKMYALQAKYIRRGISFPHNILFIRGTSVPTQPHVGYIDNYINDIYMSFPAVINYQGVREVLNLNYSIKEKETIIASFSKLNELKNKIKI